MTNENENETCKNADVEIWRATADDYYAPSIHVTKYGGIGINVGGHVIVAPVEKWHECGELILAINPYKPYWMYRLGMWLLRYKSNIPSPKQ